MCFIYWNKLPRKVKSPCSGEYAQFPQPWIPRVSSSLVHRTAIKQTLIGEIWKMKQEETIEEMTAKCEGWKKKAYWDPMHDVEYQIYISAVRPCTWYTVSPDLSLFIQWTRQTTSTLWCCLVMDVKIMETTGDKWEMMNATVPENTLHSQEYWQIWFERQKQGCCGIGQDLKSNKCIIKPTHSIDLVFICVCTSAWVHVSVCECEPVSTPHKLMMTFILFHVIWCCCLYPYHVHIILLYSAWIPIFIITTPSLTKSDLHWRR